MNINWTLYMDNLFVLCRVVLISTNFVFSLERSFEIVEFEYFCFS
jgi:hypothetical protein